MSKTHKVLDTRTDRGIRVVCIRHINDKNPYWVYTFNNGHQKLVTKYCNMDSVFYHIVEEINNRNW